MEVFHVSTTSRCQMVNITGQVRGVLRESRIRSGLCVVHCPHTTAAITVNENADPDVVRDLLMGLERIAPPDWPYRHGEGNSDAHLKSSLVGCTERFIVDDGDLVLGVWQGIYFCEFDGPRQRSVNVKVIGD